MPIRRSHAQIETIASGSPRTKKHSEKIARVVWVCEQIKFLKMRMVVQHLLHISKRAEILGGEADAVEQRDLPFGGATGRNTG